ncbi:MAG: F0F1 ATP synthase subunit B [Peptococcaceae bacterium]|nr:F0F1 ATP synthase subunit B [Peptococcaceae bacterium]
MSIEPSAVICAIINFLVLFFLLKKFLYKPVFNMLDARASEIEKNMTEAEQARDEAASLKAEYEANLKNAQTKAQEIIQNANKLGEETRSEIVAKAREEAARASDKAREEIAREKEQAIKDLRAEVADLAVDAASKIIGRNVTVADHENLVNEFIKEVGDAK